MLLYSVGAILYVTMTTTLCSFVQPNQRKDSSNQDKCEGHYSGMCSVCRRVVWYGHTVTVT